MTRRQALSLLALTSLPGRAQQNRGMASRGLKPLPFGKPSGRPWDARFVNVAFSAGLRSPVVYGPVDHNDYVVESMGCGAAFLDYDNDGWQDIVQLTGPRLESTPAGAIIRLYRNNRDGTFADVTGKSGLGQSVWASGITVADYDNDGYDDLFITCWGQNLLFHNNGDGTFTDVTAKAGLIHPGIRYGTGCTWIDYDRDGKLDLFVCHYLVFDQEKIPVRGKDPGCSYLGVPVYCGPAGLPQESCRLYHNNGDGTFTDVSRESGISAVKAGYALTAAAADFDGDGWPDIYVACDTSPSLLFHNNRDGTFTEQGLEAGVSLSEDGQEQSGMGLATGDFDTDGHLDIFKTHFRGDTNVLYRNNGKGYFRDGSILLDQSMLTGESLPVEAGPDTEAYAGALVRRGEAIAEVVSTGVRTKFGRTAELVRTAYVVSTQQKAVFRVVRNLVGFNGAVTLLLMVYAYKIGMPLSYATPLVLISVLASVPVALPATFTLATAIGARALKKGGVLPPRLSAVDEAASLDVLCIDKTG